ncbi:MAG: putative membrane protein [Marinoscillum sp.]|jgi:putative membrane protein
MDKILIRAIIVVSVLIPVVVAAMLFLPFKLAIGDQEWVRSLPAFNAGINSLTTIILVFALIAIKSGKITLHKYLMLSCLLLGALFLSAYVTYHASVSSTIFGDIDHDGVLNEMERLEAGSSRIGYLTLLFTHIVFSIAVVPFVLMAFYYALVGKISAHKKLVKFTFPIWLYVSITGVLVYLMISPYYL